MAKKKQENNIRLEERLWNTAISLRGSVEPSEYKHVVFSLFFLKYAGDRFEEQRAKLIQQGYTDYIEMVEFYTKDNVFYLPSEARWSYIMENAKQDDIAIKIDSALNMIEEKNPSLKGALPDNYYSRLSLDTSKLASLLDEIDQIDTSASHDKDLMGRIYEYFLQKFAIQEGRQKGEYYTPKCIVNLIAELIQPFEGKIYDPCCGSGGMFVQSMKFIESHHGNKKQVSIYGQESITTTLKLAKMNLAIRGISANLGTKASSSFTDDQHRDEKFDFIMANPPFNQKAWRGEDELVDDERWNGYKVPPVSNANYGWILHMVSKLSCKGVAGFLLANGALSGEGTEYQIRKQLIENDLVEAIIILPRDLFYSTDISVTLWIVNKDKKERSLRINDYEVIARNRENEIFFMDLRTWGSEFEKKYVELMDKDREKISNIYHKWQVEGYENVPELCYTAKIEELRKKDYTLVPSQYIEFIDRDKNIDFDKEMERIQHTFRQILKDEKASQKELEDAFRGLGYEL